MFALMTIQFILWLLSSQMMLNRAMCMTLKDIHATSRVIGKTDSHSTVLSSDQSFSRSSGMFYNISAKMFFSSSSARRWNDIPIPTTATSQVASVRGSEVASFRARRDTRINSLMGRSPILLLNFSKNVIEAFDLAPAHLILITHLM